MLDFAHFHFKVISDKNNIAWELEIHLKYLCFFWFYFILFCSLEFWTELDDYYCSTYRLSLSHQFPKRNRPGSQCWAMHMSQRHSFWQGTLPQLVFSLFNKEKIASWMNLPQNCGPHRDWRRYTKCLKATLFPPVATESSLWQLPF